MRVFFAGFFTFGGINVPFFPVWLDARGLTASEIANCIAIPILVRVALTPFAGILADRAPNRRFVIRIFIVLAAVAMLFAWPAHSYPLILLTTGTSTVLFGLALPVAEALALTGVRRFGIDYGRMRLGGSVAFVITNVASGILLSRLLPEAIFWFMVSALVAATAVAFTLPVTPPAVRALDDAARPAAKPARALLKRPAVLALMFAGGLIQGSHAVLYSFGSIYWQKLGFTTAEIGAFWAIGVICEIGVFMWSGRAVRLLGPLGLVACGALAAILRWTLFPFDLGFFGYLALQTLHGLTFGATYAGNQHAIARSVPEELTGSAQGIFGMITGVTLAVATAVAGPLYTHLGNHAFTAMIVMPVAALGIVLVLHRQGMRTVASR
jgi:PPP family 3-phenylpropionic acid transporter